MKKKMLPIIFAVCLMASILAGCAQNEEVITNSEVSSDVVGEVVENETASDSEMVSAQKCTLCEREIACGSYEADGYDEFATAHGLK